MSQEERLQNLIFLKYGNPHAEKICKCGNGLRVIKCRDDGCFQYQTSCRDCFIKKHRDNPFHWALVWDTEKKAWNQNDYSELAVDCSIQLHHTDDEICTGVKSSNVLRVTHTNGIHTTRVRFCGCEGTPDKLEQLMEAGLFPGTTSEPRSAYTFAVLKEFHMHNLQSKCGAFDYVLSLRRLTDNVFTSKVPVSYLFSDN